MTMTFLGTRYSGPCRSASPEPLIKAPPWMKTKMGRPFSTSFSPVKPANQIWRWTAISWAQCGLLDGFYIVSRYRALTNVVLGVVFTSTTINYYLRGTASVTPSLVSDSFLARLLSVRICWRGCSPRACLGAAWGVRIWRWSGSRLGLLLLRRVAGSRGRQVLVPVMVEFLLFL